MDTKKFGGRISRLAELAGGWENHDNIDPIERDLALELLRGLYAELRFWEAPEQEIIEETAQAIAPEPEPLPAPIPEPENEAIPEPVACAAPEPEPVAEPEPVSEPKPLPEPEPAPAAEEIPLMPRRGVNPDVIRSLYGDSTPAPAPAPAPTPAQAPAQTPAPAPAPQEYVAEPEPSATGASSSTGAGVPVQSTGAVKAEGDNYTDAKEQVIKETPQSAAGTTLGDTINTERQTLGDTMQNGRKHMASQIAASEHPDLKRSIGINDRFLMIRDMFDGDAAAYETAISKLDTFTDLDDVIIYIHDTYNWNADSDGVKLLIDLLERKLG